MPLSLEFPLESLTLELLDESLARMRIVRPQAEERMRRSLEKHGQLSAVTVCKRQTRYEMVDGFKRLRAARQIPGWTKLSARIVEGDECVAKKSMLMFNQQGSGLSALEEAWVIQSLHREHRMTQPAIATLLCRHQSWVSRRLSLAEKLTDVAQEQVRLGVLTPSTARLLASMPRGIQEPLLTTIQREALSFQEVDKLTELMINSDHERQKYLMAHAREILDTQTSRPRGPNIDPRLGEEAGRLQRLLQKVEAGCLELRGRLSKSDQLKLTTTERGILDSSMHSLRGHMGRLLEILDFQLNLPVDF